MDVKIKDRRVEVTNLTDEAEKLRDYWSPQVVGRVNDQYVMVAKLKGGLAWHKHDHEDELFYILEGDLVIEYEDRKVHLSKGDSSRGAQGDDAQPGL